MPDVDERLDRIERRVEAIWNLLLGFIAIAVAAAVLAVVIPFVWDAVTPNADEKLDDISRCIAADDC